MKIYLLIAILILDTNTSFCQKMRFSDSTNKWTFITKTTGGTQYTDTGTYAGDTLIDNKKYSILGTSYIREDTLANKVYVRNSINGLGQIDTTEQVLYNYNLSVGDSVSVNDSIFSTKNWVVAMTTTMINGISYKVWEFKGLYFDSLSTPYNYYIIEGIGCTNGLFYPMTRNPYYDTYSNQLACFKHNGNQYPLSNGVPSFGLKSSDNFNFDNSSSCAQLGVYQAMDNRESTLICPNPITESSKIKLACLIASGSLTIMNTLGQIIIQIPFQNKQELPVGDLIKYPGIYFYRVTDNSSSTAFTGKFVY